MTGGGANRTELRRGNSWRRSNQKIAAQRRPLWHGESESSQEREQRRGEQRDCCKNTAPPPQEPCTEGVQHRYLPADLWAPPCHALLTGGPITRQHWQVMLRLPIWCSHHTQLLLLSLANKLAWGWGLTHLYWSPQAVFTTWHPLTGSAKLTGG